MEEENQVGRATQSEEDALEMQVRASNMVRAGESLMKLVSDLKQYLILNDFPVSMMQSPRTPTCSKTCRYVGKGFLRTF